jgi:hypothetical protein
MMSEILQKLEVPIKIPGTTVPYQTVQAKPVPIQRLSVLEDMLLHLGLGDPFVRLVAGFVVVDGIIFLSKPDWAFGEDGKPRVWRPKAGYSKRAQEQATWVPWWVPGVAAGLFLGLFV